MQSLFVLKALLLVLGVSQNGHSFPAFVPHESLFFNFLFGSVNLLSSFFPPFFLQLLICFFIFM